ncbi:hypothetical protein B566_EDAN018545 [Ephemera danica]|nr:hypothetical protein B566_EDAN018545 [Ephemera danica]
MSLLVMVTGCTRGIGLAYSRELAQRGMNLVLIGIPRDDLEKVSKQIISDFKVQTKIIVADFSRQDIYPSIASKLKGIDIGILLNNVGVLTPYPMYFEEISEQQLWEHILINTGAVTLMTSIILPDMKAKRRGAIVNIAIVVKYRYLSYVFLKLWTTPVHVVELMSVAIMLDLVSVLGWLVVLYYVVYTLVFYLVQEVRLLVNHFRPANFVKKYGEWAVVTGCTDGIGLAYARELARRGMNVVLISRSKEKLEAAARHIVNDFHVKTKIVAVDFSEGSNIYQNITKYILDLDIGILGHLRVAVTLVVMDEPNYSILRQNKQATEF